MRVMRLMNSNHCNIFRVYLILLCMCTCMVQVVSFPSHLSHAIENLWTTMNDKWSRYPKLGVCRGNTSILERFDGFNFCEKRKFLYSKTVGGFLELSKLTSYVKDQSISTFINYAGNVDTCHQPTGGQIASISPLISYVITTYNHASMTMYCLLELFRTANEAPSAEFIIIDDYSSSNMLSLINFIWNLEYFFGINIRYVRLKKSHGYLAATNKGIRLAKGKYVVLLNSDVFVIPGWLHMLLYTMETYGQWSKSENATGKRQVGIVGPMMLNNDTKIMEAGGGISKGGYPFNYYRGRYIDTIPLQYAIPVDYVSAACILIRREIFIKYNLYDSAFYPAYYEDTDAAVTLQRNGYVTVFQPYSVVIHPEGKTYTSEQKLKLMEARGQLFRDKHKQHFANLCPGALNHPQYYHEGNSFYRQTNRILFLEDIIPEPDRDAGSIRLTEILHLLIDLEYSVTLETLNYNLNTAYYLNLLIDGIQIVPPGSLRAMATGMYFHLEYDYFKEANISFCPWELIIVARRIVYFQGIRYIKTICPDTPIIYDTVDVHYIREFRMFDLEFQNASTHDAIDSHHAIVTGMNLELKYMQHSAVTYVVSTEEYKQVKLKLPTADVRILSNIYNVDESLKTLLPPQQRNDAVFVGNFCHSPNVDAVIFIVNELLAARNKDQLPVDFKVHLVLSRTKICLDPILEVAVQHPQITMHYDISNAELLDIHNKVKVVLAPLRAGAGVKGKINYALLHGVPLIATPIAQEGMGLEHNKHALIASTANEFIKSINRLYVNNDNVYEKLQKNGILIMKANFGREIAKNTLQKSLLDVLGPHKKASEPYTCLHLSLFETLTTSSRIKYSTLKSLWKDYWLNKGTFLFPLYPNLLFNIHLFQYKGKA